MAVASTTDGSMGTGKIFTRLWIVFFFHGMVPGFWFPALTNILSAQGMGAWVALAFMTGPLGAMISPLIVGALADQRVSAERLYVWSTLAGAVVLWVAFQSLAGHWGPWWFISCLLVYAVVSGPSWGLLATVALTHLNNGEKHYPVVRMGATVGWMVAGFLASYAMHADASPLAGFVAALVRVAGGLCALGLPLTPPLGRPGSWRSTLGLDGFRLLRERDHLVFFTVTFLFSIPLTAFYMLAPEHLRVLGNAHPTAMMTIAQWSEVAAMLGVGAVMLRFRLKTLLLWALGLSVLRYAMSAYAGATGELGWHIGGIALHGVCYTFYFITAQVFLDRRVEVELRGQAQGLLTLASSGLGPLLGALVCGLLRDHWVRSGGEGWQEVWLALGAMIAVCMVLLAIFYRGEPAGRDVA